MEKFSEAAHPAQASLIRLLGDPGLEQMGPAEEFHVSYFFPACNRPYYIGPICKRNAAVAQDREPVLKITRPNTAEKIHQCCDCDEWSG